MILSIRNSPIKIKKTVTHTFSNNHVKLELKKGSLLFPIFNDFDDIQVGWLFSGKLSIFGDLIVHTNNGAAGKIVSQQYTHSIFMPVVLEFLSFNAVKEINPLSDFSYYTKIMDDFNKKIVFTSFIRKTLPNTFIWGDKSGSFWMISKEKTFFVHLPEVLAREKDDNLLYLDKKGFTIVKNGVISFETSTFLSGQKIRKFISEMLGSVNIDTFLRNFNITF
ncbi:MAG: hypothetical protein K9W46_11155 [Candidatus Heimdallarchaeum endolithica]|uniref:Uncharacterized protein n=1 Tax=Candidatus Heimdallarchaeum endolithica TaxID=2876572 RepID=A0A9Y1BQ07_9ARCH|nr:MAG: hypothetical protein K9W46_11155 [Candidatus Heimdallarchaeum endolithica]